MKLTVQVVLHADDDTETVVREVFTLQREQPLAPDTLGLQLGEAKDLLAAVQDTLVEHQVVAALSAQVECPECGLPRRHKDSRPIVARTLFGRLRLDSPRWWHCGCSPRAALTFSPLASILPERTTPELSYLQVRTRVLNNTLTNDYRRWYPGFTHTSEPDPLDDQLVAA